MKKLDYTAPTMEVVHLECEQMIASSHMIYISSTPTENDATMAPHRRGTWGNLWDKSEE